MTETVTATPERDFLATLSEMPSAMAEGTEGLTQLLNAIRETGGKGSISLTLTIAPNKNDESIKELTAVVKVAAPKRKPKPTIMFDQFDGTLGRRDPNAISFEDLREAPARPEPTQIKEARR